jgi:hypothetical protein
VLEASSEAVLVQAIKELGGIALKLQPYVAGIPDRLILMPGGRAFLVELKQEDGSTTKIQRVWHERLAKKGHPVTVLKGADQIREWVSKL